MPSGDTTTRGKRADLLSTRYASIKPALKVKDPFEKCLFTAIPPLHKNVSSRRVISIDDSTLQMLYKVWELRRNEKGFTEDEFIFIRNKNANFSKTYFRFT